MSIATHTATVAGSAFRATIDRATMTRALTTVGLAFDATCPRAVRLDGTRGALVLSASSTNTTITVRVPGAVESTGRLVVDHAELTKLITALAKGHRKRDADALPVMISASDPDRPLVDVAGYTVPLTPYPVDALPTPLPAPPVAAQVDRTTIAAELARVLLAIDTTTTALPPFNGVLLDINPGALRLAGTDRYRLGIAQVPAVTTMCAPDSAVVSGRLLAAIAKRWDGGHVRIGLRRGDTLPTVALTCGQVTVVTRAVSDSFPNYTHLMPTDATGTVTVNRAALLEHTHRTAGVLAAKRCNPGQLALTLTPSTVFLEPVLTERADEVTAPAVAAHTQGITEPVTRWFNATYLLDALTSFTSETVTLHITDGPVRPVLLTETAAGLRDNTAFRHLLMTMRPPAS